MTGSRGWKKRDDFRLRETGRRKRKSRKSNQKVEEFTEEVQFS